MNLDQPTYETMNRINAAIGVVNVPPDPFARELQEAGRRALMPDELFDWTTKGAVLAALEWTRADPKRGNYHENLAGRIAFLASLMGETWKARRRLIGRRLSPAPNASPQGPPG